MILPFHLNPKNSLYFIGGHILIMLNDNSMSIDELYIQLNKSIKASYANMLYAIDWLYLIDSVYYDEKEGLLCLQKD